jgi:hypothetical protein
MWQLLALAFFGVVKAIDALSGPDNSPSGHRPAPSPESDRTQGVSGYYRRDGTYVRGYSRRPPR